MQPQHISFIANTAHKLQCNPSTASKLLIGHCFIRFSSTTDSCFIHCSVYFYPSPIFSVYCSVARLHTLLFHISFIHSSSFNELTSSLIAHSPSLVTVLNDFHTVCVVQCSPFAYIFYLSSATSSFTPSLFHFQVNASWPNLCTFYSRLFNINTGT